MSESFQELADIPKDFFRDGTQFINRCTKRMSLPSLVSQPSPREPTKLPCLLHCFARRPLRRDLSFILSFAQEITSELGPQANDKCSGSTRVPQDLAGGRHGVSDHGRDWVYHKTESVHSPLLHILPWRGPSVGCGDGAAILGQQANPRVMTSPYTGE